MPALADLTPAAPDPILGLTEAFKADPRPEKVNLSVGVYQDASGKTPTLQAIVEATQRLAMQEGSKSYLPMTGFPAYVAGTQQLVFGPARSAHGDRLFSLQAPGGTGALRVVADFLRHRLDIAKIWVSTPTWANHPGVFQAAGLAISEYAYFDAAANGVDFDAMMASLQTEVQPGDALVLHACCHNPTGADLTPGQWNRVANLCAARRLVPVLDFAYQGFGEGLAEDRAVIDAFVAADAPFFVASSYSKNFGLYQDRVGLLSFFAETPAQAQTVASQLKTVVRTNYSNPPAHGGLLVATVLADTALTASWEAELATMRARIQETRDALVAGLREAGVERDFRFLTGQKGMFSFTGLTKDQVATLREDHAIYIVNSGRINVAGLNPTNLPRVCAAIGEVLG